MLRLKCVRLLAGALLVVLLAAAPRGNAAGFALYEEGNRANALAGAFVAQADDPSAMFFNPAGLAFNEKLTLYGGAFLVFRPTANFTGSNPYPGDGYYTGMEKATYWLGHGYGVIPIKPGKINVGVGFWSPFGLGVPWANPDSYAGRFISQRVDIRQAAVSVEIAAKLTDWLALGAGPEMRFTDVKLSRNVGILNPFNDRMTDVAHLSLISQGTPVDWTWNAGIMITPCERFRLGASYHGNVNVDLSGTAEFYQISTGNAQLDAAAAAKIPMNQPLNGSTRVQFPSVLMFGAAYDLSPSVTVNVAANYTGWNTFKETTITIQGVPPSTVEHNWKDMWTFRGGLGWQVSEPVWLAAGFLYDTSPQPDADVGPLLPDNNRTGVTVGAGFQLSKMFRVDISSLFLWFHTRTTSTNEAGFNGTYKTMAILPGISLKGTF